MNEVSCKVFSIFFRPLSDRGIAVADLVDGTGVTAEKLRDGGARIDWAQFAAVMRNMHAHFSDQELVELGRNYLRAPGLRFAMVIGRLLFTPMGFYRWFSKPREGVGNQMFTCVKPTHRELSASEIELDLELPDDLEPSWEFFLVSQGNVEELPRLLGCPRAQVTLERIPRGGRYHIRVPERVPLLTRLYRMIAWPFTARAAARELQEAHESLTARYLELEAARTALVEHQATLEQTVAERTAELSQARDELAGTVEQLRDAQGARERFFGNVSHEIRTPLSIILLAADDILHRAGPRLDEQARGSLGAVTDAARKLVRLVDELLLLAVGQESKLRLHPEPTDVTSVVAQIVAAWRPAAAAAGLELAWLMPVRVIARVDPVAMERVATNLVSNAVKYTPRGGRVDLELADEPAGLRLSVLDTGKGIGDDLAPRLFGRFERAHGEDRRKVGTGLGLSLVKQLVEAHGGTVTAHARADVGTELRVLLPPEAIVRDAPPTEAPRLEGLVVDDIPARPALAAGAKLGPPGPSAGTLLLVEDDAKLAEMVARFLAGEYTVIVAYDGETALGLVAKHQPQLLVTDVDMPGMSGIELARRFREQTGDRLAPVIILSAVHDMTTRLAGLDAGAIDYITKPFDALELRARVRAQFAMRDLAVRLHRAEQLSSLGILTAGLAHELRNPANGIVNAYEPLISMLPADLTGADSPTGQLLGVMKSCADQIGFLARQMLGLRSTEVAIDVRAAKLRDLVQRALDLARPALEGVDVRMKLADRAVSVAPPLFVQVLTNLVENGGHAAGAGGWIEIAARDTDGALVLEVADSGPGVPAELRERVFEPFFTTKPPGQGTGLGLPLARTIVQRHGGVLEIREVGARLVFAIELPQQALDLAGRIA